MQDARNEPSRGGGRRLGSRDDRRRTEGFTLIELIAAASILALVTLGVAAAMITSLNLSRSNRETRAASLLARQAAEQIRSIQPVDLLAMLGPDPATATPLAGTPLDAVYRLSSPELRDVSIRLILPRDPGTGVLLETLYAPELGLPRDLNLDGAIEAGDRSADCAVLPVRIRIGWRGARGERAMEIVQVLLANHLRGSLDANI